MKRRYVILLSIAALVLGLWIGWQARSFVAVDACLDHGGAWVKNGGYCRFR